jgi:hypothetical protein
MRPCLKKTHPQKKGGVLEELLKVQALSSNPTTEKKKKRAQNTYISLELGKTSKLHHSISEAVCSLLAEYVTSPVLSTQ